MPDEYRDRHIWILGMTGVGKTGMQNQIAMSDIVNGYHSTIVVDPLGASLTSTLVEFLGLLNMQLTLAAQTGMKAYDERIRQFRDRILERTIVLDFADPDCPWFFNPLETVDGLTPDIVSGQTLRSFSNANGADLDTQLLRQLNLKAAFSLVAAAGGTILDCPRFYSLDSKGFSRFIEYLTNKAEAEGRTLGLSFVREYAERFLAGVEMGRERRDREQSCQTALNIYLGDECCRRLISAPHGNLNFDKIINDGKILLVNIPQGTDLNTTKILGQMIVDRVRLTCERRTKKQREKKVTLICDEFHLLFGPSWSESFATVRNTGLNLVISNQNMGQLQTSEFGEHLMNSVRTNTSTQIFFRLGEDAQEIAFSVFRPRGDKEHRRYTEVTNSRGMSHAVSESRTISETFSKGLARATSQTFSFSKTDSVSFSEGEGVAEAEMNGISVGISKGKSRARIVSHSHGVTITRSESETHVTGSGNAHATSHADGKNSSTSNSSGTSSNTGNTSAQFISFNNGSNASHKLGFDTSLGAVAESSGHGHGTNAGNSESHGMNDSFSSSEGYSISDAVSDVVSSAQSLAKGTSKGRSVANSVSVGNSEGESESESLSRSLTRGMTFIRNYCQSAGEALSRGISQGITETITETESHGTSTSTGETHTENQSRSETEKTEWYDINSEARVRAYDLMDLPRREAYVLTRENGKVHRIRTHDVPYEFNNVLCGIDFTADFLKKSHPAVLPEIPDDSVFDRIEAERKKQIRRKEPKEF